MGCKLILEVSLYLSIYMPNDEYFEVRFNSLKSRKYRYYIYSIPNNSKGIYQNYQY